MGCIGKYFRFCDVSVPQQYFELPMDVGVVYVCKSDARVDFICPCGCGDIITLNTLADTKPCWTVSGNSISPSVNRRVGCRSHFTITGGFTH
jgi:hypothetical protein